MSRHSSEPAIVGTSIALLQERFRQLQKDKVRREKKEVVKLLSDSNSLSTSRDLAFNSLSLGLNLGNAGKQVDSHEGRLMPGDTKVIPITFRSYDTPDVDVDVDTTLHL